MIITEEELAKKMYDRYCQEVGGLAFNGSPLPTSETFFNDDKSSKQANAWRECAKLAIEELF